MAQASQRTETNPGCPHPLRHHYVGVDLAEADFSDIIDYKVYSDTTVIESRLNELDTSDIGSLLARVYSDTTLATAAAGEPAQGVPPASATAMNKIDYLYKAWRNKTEQTATTYSLYDDAGTTVDHKASVSDDATTFTRNEVGTGP